MSTLVRRTAYFSMKAPNRAGQGARLLNALAAHKANLLAVTAGAGRYGAMFWVKARDVARASRVLRAR